MKPKADGVNVFLVWVNVNRKVHRVYNIIVRLEDDIYVYNIDTQIAGAIQATAYSHGNR